MRWHLCAGPVELLHLSNCTRVTNLRTAEEIFMKLGIGKFMENM